MSRSRLFSCLVCTLLIAVLVFASDKKSGTQQSSNLRFTVVKDDNNKPVRNASVVLHPVGKNGKQAKGGFQLKTDNDGKTESDGLPYGLLRVQVLAPGFQTFGDDYDINKPDMDIQIRLKRPTDQTSAYDKSPDKSQTAPAVPAEPKPQ
jgi:Carboxypeptidase regulatory-like domain